MQEEKASPRTGDDVVPSDTAVPSVASQLAENHWVLFCPTFLSVRTLRIFVFYDLLGAD